MKQKTVKQWLEKLPKGYRERAIKNVTLSKDDLNCQDKNMESAISGAFIWSRTEEGHDFWSAVREHYVYGNDLPVLPE